MPSCAKNLIDALLLRRCRGGRVAVHELTKTEDGMKRRAQFVAHPRKEIRFHLIRFFRNYLGVFQFNILGLEYLLEQGALCLRRLGLLGFLFAF